MRLTKHPLFKNTSVYVFADCISKAIPFFMLPILTRFMSPSDYGIVATFLVFVAILNIFIGLSTHGAVTVNFFKLDRGELQKYVANIMLILVVSTLITSFILIFFSGILAKYFVITKTWILIAPFLAFCQFLTLINLVLWQSEQRPKPFGMYQILQALVNVSLIVLFVVILKMRWDGQLLAMSISTVLFAIFSVFFIIGRGYLKFKFHREYIKDALFFGIPLMPHQLSAWFRTAIDRILISTMVGVAATGIYSVGYQVGMIIGLFGGAFNKAWAPFLFDRLKSADQYQKAQLVKFSYLCFVLILAATIFLSFFAPWFMRFFVGVQFKNASNVVVWIAVGYAFDSMYYLVANQIFYVKATHLLAAVTFISSIIHVILSYSLIKLNGAIGSAQATAISFFIMFIMVWILSSKVYPMPWLNFMKTGVASDRPQVR